MSRWIWGSLALRGFDEGCCGDVTGFPRGLAIKKNWRDGFKTLLTLLFWMILEIMKWDGWHFARFGVCRPIMTSVKNNSTPQWKDSYVLSSYELVWSKGGGTWIAMLQMYVFPILGDAVEPGSPLSKAFRKEWISGGFGAEARDVFTCFTEFNLFFYVFSDICW